MKLFTALIIILGISIFQTVAQESFSDHEQLKELDASWEKAQLELNLEYIDSLLAENFIWVHNHANVVDSKMAVLDRVKRHLKENNQSTKSRTSSEVKVIVHNDTGIVSGFTVVDRGPSPTKYHFMRTYVKDNGKYYLIANHTMAIPEKE